MFNTIKVLLVAFAAYPADSFFIHGPPAHRPALFGSREVEPSRRDFIGVGLLSLGAFAAQPAFALKSVHRRFELKLKSRTNELNS